jgi:ParE toxin of type II toxin-antitoxin system, parDE
MKIEYLHTSQVGAQWLRKYYRRNPQLDFQKIKAALRAAENTLSDFPFSGECFEERENVREYPIQGSNFSLLYTVARNKIWIIDIRDSRGHRSADALAAFSRELRSRFGIGVSKK